MRTTSLAFGLVALWAAGVAAQSTETWKRFWVNEAEGFSIGFPHSGDPLASFNPARRAMQGDEVLVMNRPIMFANDPASGVAIGNATCAIRRSFENDGAKLQEVLAQSRVPAGQVPPASKQRCESAAYPATSSERQFYGAIISESPLGLREICTVAYTLPEMGQWPRIVSRMTLFSAGQHGYEMRCMMAVKNDSAARSNWQQQARTFAAIEDSLARTPATR